MDTALVAIYCLCDDFLKAQRHRDDPQSAMTDAEVLTTALAAARFYGGNVERARAHLHKPDLIPRMLSKSQFNRRIHRLTAQIEHLFAVLGQCWSAVEAEAEAIYLMDAFPVSCCDNIRIRRSRLYPLAETEGAHRGYIASKKRFFYGVKLHLLTTSEGRPVEMKLTPGATSDHRGLDLLSLSSLPEGATVYGDKSFNDYFVEDELFSGSHVRLLPIRCRGSKRAVPAYVYFVQHHRRKRIETAGSLIERLWPHSIHAVTSRGFELKVVLFVLAYSITFGL